MPKARKRVTDDDREAKVSRITRKMLLWLGFLQQYRLVVCFTDDIGVETRPAAVAKVDDSYPYRTITIQLERDFIDQADRYQIEEIMLHEVLHVLIFGPLEHRVAEDDIDLTDYLDPQESAIEQITIWIMLMRQGLRDKAWDL